MENYNGIVYTVSSKAVCTYHAADAAGLPLCGVVPAGDWHHTPSPQRHDQAVNCSRCWRSLNAAVRKARQEAPVSIHTQHWTVQGVPACSSSLTADPIFDPPSVCEVSSDATIEAFMVRLLAAHPGVDVAAVEGGCTGDPLAERDERDEEYYECATCGVTVTNSSPHEHAEGWHGKPA